MASAVIFGCTMKSMTGYGTSRAEKKGLSIEISIRTVNGRFLEPRFHLPREFHQFESDLKKKLSEVILRGTCDIFVSRRLKNHSSNAQLQLNSELAKKYYQAYQKLSKELKLNQTFHVEQFARLPEVISIEQKQELIQGEEVLLKKVFQAALTANDKERNREGLFLKKDLLRLLSTLEKVINCISELREAANADLQSRYETKVKNRLKGQEIDPQRLTQEIVIQLERADINEELTRLSEHINNYRQLLESQTAEGKKLDFYTQELLREVNTIGSKSQIAQITTSVVEAKTLIERMREQVQNVQ